MSIEQVVYLLAFTGIFLLGVYGAVEATKQSRAERRWTALVMALLASILTLVGGFVLLMAAAWLLG